ncbi:MAG: T9SS type A sorting domain-containing protein [Ferruginibacter sp.]
MKTLFTYFLLVIITMISMKSNAQVPVFEWAKSMGAAFADEGHSVVVDVSGNVYTTGTFRKTVDFDPGPGVFNLTTAVGNNGDVFISKLDVSGNFVWAKSLGGGSEAQSNSITLDASGNIYTTGFFTGTADFDPGAGVFNLVSINSYSIFISKLDASGNFVWAKSMGGAANSYGQAIKTDASGSVYTTGTFQFNVDFDPNAGSFVLTAAGGQLVDDIFISKLDASGNFVWAKRMGGTLSDQTNSIELDASGNIYSTGNFGGTADFDPGAGTFNLTATSFVDKYVLKLDVLGNFVWAKALGESYSNVKPSMSVDQSGNVYTSGAFRNTADFDPGPGVFNLTTAGFSGSFDIYISKLNASGNFVWAKQIGGVGGDCSFSTALDASGNVYTTGTFYETVDFDPGAGVFTLSSPSDGIFVSKLDPSGNFLWAANIGGYLSSNAGRSIVLDNTDNIYTTGFFQGTTDVDPGPGTFTLTYLGATDIFVHKMSQSIPVPAPVISSFTPGSAYTGSTITITGANFNRSLLASTNLSGVTAVKIAGIDVSSFTVVDATTITAIVAPGTTTGMITVTTPNGDASSATNFIYLGYITANNGYWDNDATWFGGTAPLTGSSATINNIVALNIDINISSGNSIIVNGTLHTGIKKITGSGSFNLAADAVLACGNPAGINGSITTTKTLSTAANYLFNGTGPQNTSGMPSIVKTLTAANASGANLTLSNDVTINQQLSLTNGIITTGFNKIVINITGNITGTSSSNYINGRLQRAVAAGSSIVNFPIGDATIYRPVTVNFNGVPAGNLLVNVSQSAGDHPFIGTSTLDPNRSVNRYWTLIDVNNTLTSGTYDATFEFVQTDKDALANPANFTIAKYSAAGWTYPVSVLLDPLHVKANAVNGFGNFAIAEPLNPVITCNVSGSGTTTPVSCFGNTNGTAMITLTGDGSGAPGSYKVDGGIAQSYITNPFSITGLASGNHTIIATVTAGGCESSNILVNVGTAAIFTATYIKTNISACNIGNDGTISVTPGGGTAPYTYSWTGSNGYTHGNTSFVNNLPIGYYNVTVTDANNCGIVTLSNIHIEFAYYVYVTNSGSVSSSCGNTGSVSLYGNAGILPYMYSLNGITYQPANTFTGLAAGTYTGYVKDAGGCVSTKAGITVTAAAPITVSPFARSASSCANDGSIEIYRSGGIPPYTYSLDNIIYVTGNVFNNLSAGPYTVYVKDSKACIGSQTVTIAQGAALILTAGRTNTSTCVNDGSIQVNVSGGISPYAYSINGGSFQAGNSFSGLATGTYTISVKDLKGCLGSVNVVIALNSIVVSASVVNAGSCTANNGKIQLFRSGGYGPYTYSLDGNTYQAATVFTNLPAGTYTGYVKDSRACIGSVSGIIIGPAGCLGTFTRKTNFTNNQAKAIINTSLKIRVYPNPTTSEFMLQLDGNNTENILINVMDVFGRSLFQSNGNAKNVYKFGKGFIPGNYVVVVRQGTYIQTIKLEKE